MQADAAPAGSPAFGTARGFAVLGASAVTNTGSSVLTGNLGVYPGTAITGFPPGSFTGSENIANAAAQAAQASALATYTDLQARSSTVIATALDGQTLVPGVYSSAGGTFTLASAGAGTLTLNGAGVYVFQMATTLTTGAGGLPTITLSGGALASNVYWVVGSSATINSGTAGTFQGNIIAQASITDTLGGTVNGSLVALTGAVTLSAATVANAKALAGTPAAGNPNPEPGVIVVKLQDNYQRYYGGWDIEVSALGAAVTSVVANKAYVISALGTATVAQWVAKGLPIGVLPAVGVAFIASAAGSIGGSAAVKPSALNGSGIDHIESLGDANLTINPSSATIMGQASGAYLIYQCFSGGVLTAPTDGSLIMLSIYLSSSMIKVQGE